MRAETRQGQQGDHCVKHHVRRRPVPALFARSLEVFEDGCQQAIRVYARDARRRPGHGLRHLHQNRTKVQTVSNSYLAHQYFVETFFRSFLFETDSKN